MEFDRRGPLVNSQNDGPFGLAEPNPYQGAPHTRDPRGADNVVTGDRRMMWLYRARASHLKIPCEAAVSREIPIFAYEFAGSSCFGEISTLNL